MNGYRSIAVISSAGTTRVPETPASSMMPVEPFRVMGPAAESSVISTASHVHGPAPELASRLNVTVVAGVGVAAAFQTNNVSATNAATPPEMNWSVELAWVLAFASQRATANPSESATVDE